MRRLAPGLVMLCLAVLGACTGIRPLPATPEGAHDSAEIPGYPGARIFGDVPSSDGDARLAELVEQIRARSLAEGGLANGGRLDSLVLSGGGSDGPFGAGLLVGWTEAGTRPDFSVVTGISAGALIAPFAFLGPDYDDELRRFTVENSTDTLITISFRLIFDGLGLVDNSPLTQKLRGLITPDVVRQIAGEHEKGRRLFIGTTNLDAQRPVYWRVSRIAWLGRSDLDRTADLITKIIVASASIPAAFPPQFFTVRANGRSWSEMHVDGGVTNQLFFLPAKTRIASLPGDIARFVRRGTIYVIRNTKLSPDYEAVEPGVVQIAARSISTLIKFGGRSDLALLEDQARRIGFGVKVTAVPESFRQEETELFDPVYMQALFETGRAMAASGPEFWETAVAPEPTSPGAVASADRRRP